jgi:hypothetical protein
MRKSVILLVVWVFAGAVGAIAQTQQAYEQEKKNTGLLDLSKLTVHRSASFGMSTASFNSNDIKSQGLYTTMLQYQFSKPLTLNVSFGLPLFSSYNSRSNLTPENLKSADYFKNMPFEGTLTWQANDKMLMQVTIARYTGASNYFSNPTMGFGRYGFRDGW